MHLTARLSVVSAMPHLPGLIFVVPLVFLGCFSSSTVHALCISSATHICISIKEIAYALRLSNQTVVGPDPLPLEPGVQYTLEMEDACDTLTHTCSAHQFGISNSSVGGAAAGESLLSSEPRPFNSTTLNSTGMRDAHVRHDNI
jgi:hypothetical protein